MSRVFSCLTGEHDWRLVVLAGVICLLTSLVAVSLFHRARATPNRGQWAWLALAGTTAGCGIWATHFIAILAYEPGVAVAYDIELTILSLVAAAVVTAAGLMFAAKVPPWAAPAGGAIVGLGVACMHYTGMWALEIPGRVTWHLDLVLASIALSTAFGAAAMAIAVRRDSIPGTVAAALLLTFAIVSHHFTAMGAVAIVFDPKLTIDPFTFDGGTLAFAIAGVVVAVLGMSLVGAIADNYLAARSEQFAQAQQKLITESEDRLRERNACLDAALNNMTQGLCMFDKFEQVVVLNRRFLEMYKLSPEVIRPGCTLIELLRHRKSVGLLEADPDQYYVALKKDLAKGTSTNWTLRTSDNRSILAHNQPMPGGGWVTTHEDITEQRNAEAQVREQKLKLDAALNNMSQGLCMFDAQARVVLCNQRYLEMYGLSAEDVTPGRKLWDLIEQRRTKGLMSESPQQYIEALEVAIGEGKPISFVVTLTDGRVISIANRPMADGRWVATHADITEQRRADEQLRQRTLQLDTALENMSQGLCMFDAQARLMLCNQRYLQMYGMSAADVWPGMTLLELLAKRCAQGTFSRDPTDYLADLRTALVQGQSFTLTTDLPGGRIVSIYNTPMPDGGWVSSHEDITEQRRAEEKLREQKLQLDAALDNMSQSLCMFDAQGRIVLFNSSYSEIMGVPPAFLRGITFLELLKYRRSTGDFAEDPEQLNAAVLSATQEGKTITKIVERTNGRVHRIVVHAIATGGWVTTLEDITVQRHADEQLREQKLQLDAALSNMSQGLCMFDAQGRVVLFNPRYAELVGYPSGSLKGLSFCELLAHRKTKGEFTGDPEQFSAAVIRGAREGNTTTRIVQQPSGRTHRIVVQPMPSGGWVSTIEDITEQRRADEKLHEQKLQLDTALNNMSQGLNMFDAAGRLVVCNERYREMYRLSPEEVRPGSTVHELVHARVANGTFFAADPEHYADELMEAMNEREPTSTEMELTDGRVIAIVGRPTPDSSGWVVTHEDITERRRVERERDRSEAFASTVIENVPATIMVKDARTLRYILVNRAGEDYLGVPREALIGKTAEQVFAKPTADVIAEHDMALLQTGVPKLYDEHPTTTPAGAIRIVTTARLPIRDKDGDMQYMLTVIEDRTNRKRAEAQIAHMAHHDLLTGLPNRAAFSACLASTIEAAAQSGESFALMSIDIDRFKEVNDVFGHSVGDDLLLEIARRLQTTVGGAFVARLGGDEFTIISTEGAQPAAAEALANQLLAVVAEDFDINRHQVRVGLSIGVSIFPVDGNDTTTLVANADAALYRAKAEGRGSYRFFEADMDKRLRERRALQHDLQTAIERGELNLNYQPQAKISSEIIGFEALARWRHPTQGPIPPNIFVPLAEESGLIIALGEWVLREACREAASWPKPLQIAINLSPAQFRHGDLPALVHSVLIDTGLAPSRLELEITEGVLIGDFSRALSILRRLKTLGVRIAMDDFGTGYSSLSYLQSFPFDKIKIDQAFISNLERNPQSATIIRAVIGLARGLNLPVLAEGVETEDQLAFLVKETCDEIQGYLIGRPLPIEEYAALTGKSPLRKPRLAVVS